jgi:hypothetical protein
MFIETMFDVSLVTKTTLFGSCPNDPSIYMDYLQDEIDTSTPEARAEVAALPYNEADAEAADHTTVFLRIDDCPGLHGHVMKGFFKSACGALWAVKDTCSVKLRAYKKRIDTLIFIEPQIIKLTPSSMPIEHLTTYLDRKTGQLVCVRPLRAETAKGPRVALARSEVLPPGTELNFRMVVIGEVPKLAREATKKEPIHEELLHEWLTYGKRHGLGSWRNAGWGQFTYEMSRVA